MSKAISLVALFVAGASVLASDAPRDVSLPASAVPQTSAPRAAATPDASKAAKNESFEQNISRLQSGIRPTKNRILSREIRALSVDLAKLTDEAYHMGIEPQRLEDLGWKISIISRKTETALGRMRKLAQNAVKDPALETAAQDLAGNAEDLLSEFRRLEITAPKIQERIGYANEDSRQFADEVVDAKETAAKIAAEAQSLLSRVK